MAFYLSRSIVQHPLRLAFRPRGPKSLPLTSLTRLMSSNNYEHILTSRPEPSVFLITLNRPKALNALSSPLFAELNKALEEADSDDSVGAMVLTGSERAFAGWSRLSVNLTWKA